MKNNAKRLHNFFKIYQLENTYLAEYLLTAAFVSFQKGIDNFGLKKLKIKNQKKEKSQLKELSKLVIHSTYIDI